MNYNEVIEKEELSFRFKWKIKELRNQNFSDEEINNYFDKTFLIEDLDYIRFEWCKKEISIILNEIL